MPAWISMFRLPNDPPSRAMTRSRGSESERGRCCAVAGGANNANASVITSRCRMRLPLQQGVEPSERFGQLWLVGEDGKYWIFAHLFHPVQRVLDREVLRVEIIVHLVPDERHRYRRARQGADAERSHDQLPVPVLEEVDVDLFATLVDRAHDRGDRVELLDHKASQQFADEARLLVRHLLPQRNHDVRSEEHTSELQSLAYLVCRLLLEKKKTYRNL